MLRLCQAKVSAAIADKDVGVLVNNVGISYPFPKYFDELSDDEVTCHNKRTRARGGGGARVLVYRN